jgi:hypothetical protein
MPERKDFDGRALAFIRSITDAPPDRLLANVSRTLNACKTDEDEDPFIPLLIAGLCHLENGIASMAAAASEGAARGASASVFKGHALRTAVTAIVTALILAVTSLFCFNAGIERGSERARAAIVSKQDYDNELARWAVTAEGEKAFAFFKEGKMDALYRLAGYAKLGLLMSWRADGTLDILTECARPGWREDTDSGICFPDKTEKGEMWGWRTKY